MTRKRREQPAAAFTTRGGTVVRVNAPDAPVAAEALPKAVLDGLLAGYQIATYEPRDRAAWKAALDAAGLEPEARAAAADYLKDRWASTPYDPKDFEPGPMYGAGLKPKLVFTSRE